MFCLFKRHATIVTLLIASSLSTRALDAQVLAGKPKATTTRAELVERLRAADSLGRKEEAFLLRTRLRDGDFSVGDVIIVTYEGAVLNKRDSLIVQADRVLVLGSPMGDLRLEGVLRFELGDSISARALKYFKEEVVRVSPLIRLGISGGARAPGFYHFRHDSPLSDVVMRGGALSTTGTFDVAIKRGEKPLWGKTDVQTALSDGLTIEELELQPGDEIVVGGAANANPMWRTILQYTIPVVTGWLFYMMQRRRN